MLCRQFARMKKAGVKPSTWLENRIGLCKPVLPAVPLTAVVATGGKWHEVSREIQQLMAHSALGKTIFNMAGLAGNAHAYKQKISDLLDIVVESGFSEDALATFKKGAEAAADSLKAFDRILQRALIWFWFDGSCVCVDWGALLLLAFLIMFEMLPTCKCNRLASRSCRAGRCTSPSARRRSTSW